jgi:biopolymer transport protein ExbB/TolQ
MLIVVALDESVLVSLTSMRTIINKVEQMKAQRRQLEEELRESIRNDDITASLAQRGNKDVEKLFQSEIKKHEKTVEYIRQASLGLFSPLKLSCEIIPKMKKMRKLWRFID